MECSAEMYGDNESYATWGRTHKNRPHVALQMSLSERPRIPARVVKCLQQAGASEIQSKAGNSDTMNK